MVNALLKSKSYDRFFSLMDTILSTKNPESVFPIRIRIRIHGIYFDTDPHGFGFELDSDSSAFVWSDFVIFAESSFFLTEITLIHREIKSSRLRKTISRIKFALTFNKFKKGK